jgi:hypothetical protein
MRSSILARIPGFRQRIIPEPHVPSRGSQARERDCATSYSMSVQSPYTPSPHGLSRISAHQHAGVSMKWRYFTFLPHVIVADKKHRVHCKIDSMFIHCGYLVSFKKQCNLLDLIHEWGNSKSLFCLSIQGIWNKAVCIYFSYRINHVDP